MMEILCEHWLAACTIIATLGFWTTVVVFALRPKPKTREDRLLDATAKRLAPDLITLDEELGIRFDMVGYDREQAARVAYRMGKDGVWRP